MNHLNGVALTIVVVSFLIVTCIGFAAARWRPAEDPMHLNEWGLGGRGFGTFVSWFLLGGDIYTAYTFIAVPALVYAAGAAGFYALSYTIMVWPIVFVFGPRLWSVARARGYVSPGEFVRGRHGSQGLGLAVAATGILATMPYIALQLVGIESVLTVMGIGGNSSNIFVRDLPLIIAFAVVSAYTYLAGLRAPALIAFVKDTLIYVTVIVAILVIPSRIGGWGHIFGVASAHLSSVNPATGKPYGNLVVLPAGQWAYATLALGSALALFVYPHAVTGVFAAKRRDVIRRNAAMLPAYTLVLGLIALFGYMARAVPAVNAGVTAGHGNAQLSVPLLFSTMFPSWFAGIAYAAIIIGALVPAAVMSIAAANLFTRTIYKELFRPYATPAEETRVARLASLLMKVGALGFALELNKTFSINLQLLGGIWILQTFPAVVIGLYTRWFHRAALIFGWAGGNGLRNGRGVSHFRRRAGALRRLRGAGVRAHHLHRDHGAAAEPGGLGRAERGVQEVRPAGRVRRDQARRLHRGPGARACACAEGAKAREAEPAADGKAPQVPAVVVAEAWPRRRRLRRSPKATVYCCGAAVEDDATVVFEDPCHSRGDGRSVRATVTRQTAPSRLVARLGDGAVSGAGGVSGGAGRATAQPRSSHIVVSGIGAKSPGWEFRAVGGTDQGGGIVTSHGRATEPPGRPSRDRKYGHTHNSPGTGYDYSYPSVTQSPPNPTKSTQ